MICILKLIYNWFPYKYKMIEYKNDDWVVVEKPDYIEYLNWFFLVIFNFGISLFSILLDNDV